MEGDALVSIVIRYVSEISDSDKMFAIDVGLKYASKLMMFKVSRSE